MADTAMNKPRTKYIIRDWMNNILFDGIELEKEEEE